MRAAFCFRVTALASILLTGGCSGLYFNTSDPAKNVPVKAVIKSIRCELVSFFAINFQRAIEFNKLERQQRLAEAIELYPFLPIDRRNYASVLLNTTENVNAGLSVGLSIRDTSIISGSPDLKTWRALPSASLMTTYERGQPLILPQFASVGPVSPGSDSTTQIYDPSSSLDQGYFCYKPISRSAPKRREERLADLQDLVSHKLPELENFDRIFVNGTPMAVWLGLVSREAAANRRTILPNDEGIESGQLTYSFSLMTKFGGEGDYTLVARHISPFVPGGNASTDTTGKFSIVINLKKASLSVGAQNGNAAITGSDANLIEQTPD